MRMLLAITVAMACSAGLALHGADAPAVGAQYADQLVNKVMSDHLKESDKSYAAYRADLESAKAKITKALDGALRDLNGNKKAPQMDVEQRAIAVRVIRDRIQEILNEDVVDREVSSRYASPLGDEARDARRRAVLGSWIEMPGYNTVVFAEDGTVTSAHGGVTKSGTWSIKNGSVVVCFPVITVCHMPDAKGVMNAVLSDGHAATLTKQP